MKTSTLSLLTAFVSAALVTLVGAQESSTKPGSGKSTDKTSSDKNRDSENKDISLPATQTDFVKAAHHSLTVGEAAVQLAGERATSAKVKELAQSFATQQKEAATELRELAGKLEIQLPGTANDSKEALAALRKAPAADFDQAFLNFMTASRRRSIELYERGAKVSSAEPVLTYIEKILPSLRSDAQKLKALGGVDEEMARLDGRQNEAPRVPKIPDTEIPGPR